MCAFTLNFSSAKNVIQSHNIVDYQNDNYLKDYVNENQTLIQFFKKSILAQQKEMLPKYKSLLLELEEKEGLVGIIQNSYYHTDRLAKLLPLAKFNPKTTTACMTALERQVNKKKRKNEQLFNFSLFFIMTCSIYSAANYFSDENKNTNNMMGNLFIILMLGLCTRLAQAAHQVHRFRTKLDNVLTLTLEFIPNIPNKVKSVTTNTFLTPPPAPHMTVSPPTPQITSNRSEDFELRVTVAIPKPPKRWQLWTQPENKSSEPDKKQDNNEISPNYFGPAFSDTPDDNFVKLEGGGLGAQSQLYGIWYGIDEPEAKSLYIKFKNGLLVAPEKPGIKKLTVNSMDGNYWEIKATGAARVIGKEFTTKDKKTVIVFTSYAPNGMHGGTSDNRRIIEGVNSEIQRLSDMNTSNVSNVHRP